MGKWICVCLGTTVERVGKHLSVRRTSEAAALGVLRHTSVHVAHTASVEQSGTHTLICTAVQRSCSYCHTHTLRRVYMCVQVFKNPCEVLTVLMIQTLGAMVPSIPDCIAVALKRCSGDCRLDVLLELHQTAANFSRSLEAAMQPQLGACTPKNPVRHI